jgi:hypothetical protein
MEWWRGGVMEWWRGGGVEEWRREHFLIPITPFLHHSSLQNI